MRNDSGHVIGGGIRCRGGGAATTSATNASISSFVHRGGEVGHGDVKDTSNIGGGDLSMSSEDCGDDATLSL